MYFGAAWYPEHWPVLRWSEDVRLMREAGMNVCRLAEFAWSSMEPTENHYALDWLDHAITLLHENGIAVVLGTPTAAPPAWLTRHHPDTLAIEPNGRPAQHGNRCHYSPASTTYIRYCRRIVEQMAKRFGQDERVIGWQIDNEYSRVDYSDSTSRLFQAYLKDKYQSLEALNAHWSTAYWSQTYQSWDEIPIPIGAHNPGLMLAFRHFTTKIWRDFQHTQVDTLRMNTRPEQWITHNFMGWFDGFDHYRLSEELDFATWDWYIGTGHHDYTQTGAIHDLTRGFKRRNFWVMETQPGNVNWSSVNNVLNKGEARAMAFHAAAHGADGFLYWQWRSAPGGQEQLHGSLIGADGNPRPFYSEAAQIGADFAKISEAMQGTTPVSEVAMLHSYDSRWSINAQRHHKDFDPIKHFLHYYAPLAQRNVSVDVLSAEASLEGYKLVILPSLVVLPEKTIENLTAFVEAGGTLVLTVRCGQKDGYNALFPALQPGPLRDLAGVEVADFYPLDEPVPVRASWAGQYAGQGEIWAERLTPLNENVQTLAHFGESNGWLDGGAALTINPVGSKGGKVIYVGAWLNTELQDQLTNWILGQAQVVSAYSGAARTIEVGRRVGADGKELLFVINHSRQEAALKLAAPLPNPATDMLTGAAFTDMLPLPPYGVRVLSV